MGKDMTREAAIQHCKNGARAALFMGVITLAVVSIAMLLDDPGQLATWASPENAVDVLILLGCAWGMHNNSRAAAIVAIIYLVLSTVYLYLQMGPSPGFVVKLIFLYFFVQAARGAWAYHGIEARDNPDYSAPPPWMAWVGIPLGIIFFVLAGLGILTMTPMLPSTDVISGEQLSEAERALLVENNVLFEDEVVDFFYSEGFSSVLEGGSVLSNRAVIAYGPGEEGELIVYEFEFSDIVSIEEESPGSTLEDAVYKVSGAGEDNWIRLILSTEADGHKQFIRALQSRVDAASTSVP